MNDFRDLLELRRRQEHESPKEVLSKVDTVIDGKPHYYELSHKVEHESLTSKFDTLTLDLKVMMVHMMGHGIKGLVRLSLKTYPIK